MTISLYFCLTVASFLSTGVLLGIVVHLLRRKKPMAGVLRVDKSEPEEPPMFFLEISRDAATSLKDGDEIMLLVRFGALTSRE